MVMEFSSSWNQIITPSPPDKIRNIHNQFCEKKPFWRPWTHTSEENRGRRFCT